MSDMVLTWYLEMNKTYKYTYNVRLLYTISIQCTPTQKEYLYDTHDEIESRTKKLEEHVERNYLNLLRWIMMARASHRLFLAGAVIYIVYMTIYMTG